MQRETIIINNKKKKTLKNRLVLDGDPPPYSSLRRRSLEPSKIFFRLNSRRRASWSLIRRNGIEVSQGFLVTVLTSFLLPLFRFSCARGKLREDTKRYSMVSL
jgi:hypothetical protein